MASENKTVITPVFRASFVHLFKQTQGPGGGKPHYSITMIIDPEHLKNDPKEKHQFDLMLALAEEAKKKKFGDKEMSAKFKKALRRGVPETQDPQGFNLKKYPEFEGKFIASARSYNQPPGVIDGRTREIIIDPQDIYSGCWCRAQVSAYGYEVSGNQGVAFGLQCVMKVEDGEPLVQRSDPKSAFENWMEEGSSVSMVANDSMLDFGEPQKQLAGVGAGPSDTDDSLFGL